MPQLILDACVAAKWLFSEPLSEKALMLLDAFKKREIQIIVPDLFFAEIANTCCKKVRNKFCSIDHAVQGLDRILKMPFERYPDGELSDVGLENALRLKISVYDGVYLALAEIYLAPLITSDEKLLKACKGKFDFIESLEDYG